MQSAPPPSPSVQPSALPPGYRIETTGHIATLYHHDRVLCAFDGRMWTRGEKWAGTYRDCPDAAQRASGAARAEAWRLCEGSGE